MILVTGGAGFIGSNVAACLAAHGRDIAVCDELGSEGKWRNLAKVPLRDIFAPDRLDEWLGIHRDAVEAIVHMGAISETSATDADRVIEVNFGLSWKLWQWCASRQKPFIYASSAATYGGGEHGFDDDASPQALALLRPTNVYGWSKHLFDQRVVRAVARGEPAPPQWVGLKFFNVYGPNEYHKGSMRSLIARQYEPVSAGRPLVLFRSCHPDYADGGQKRDFVFVDDCVDVIAWLLDNRSVVGIYNLGTGQARSFAELARALLAACGVPERIEYADLPNEIRDHYQYFTQASLERLREAGYRRPFTPIEAGIRRYVERYLSRLDRYR